MKRTTYLVVDNDIYRLPVASFRTLQEVARFTGASLRTLTRRLSDLPPYVDSDPVTYRYRICKIER